MRTTIEDVRRWKADLGAQIDRVPEVSHNELKVGSMIMGDITLPYAESVPVIDQPGIREPDISRRHHARTALQQTYDLSTSTPVAYLAGRALGKSPSELREELGVMAPAKAFVVEHPLATLAAVGTVAYGIYSWVSQFS